MLVDAVSGETRASARFAAPGVTLERCAFSADGVLLYVAGWCNTVFVRDARTLSEVRSFDVGGRHVHALATCPGAANLVFTGGFDEHAKLWDTHTGRVMCELPYWEYNGGARGAYVHHAVFSPDGSKLVTVTYQGADLWEIPSGTHLAHLADAAFCPAGAAFSVDGEDLFVANNVGRFLLVNPRTGTVELERDVLSSRRSVHMIQATLDGENLICGAEDGAVYVLTASTLKVAHRVEVGGLGTSLALAPDGDTVFVCDERGGIVRVSISEGTADRPKLSGPATALAFEDRETLVALHQGGSLARFDLRTASCEAWTAPAPWLASLSPRGRRLAIPRNDYSGTIDVFDARTKVQVGSTSGGQGWSVAVDDEGNVASSVERGVLFGLGSRARIEAPSVRQHGPPAISPNGAWIAARSNTEVTRIDAKALGALDVAKTSRGDGIAVDNRGVVVVGAGAKFIVLGDESSGSGAVTCKLERDNVHGVACSDDGSWVAAVTSSGMVALLRQGDPRGPVVFRASRGSLARVALSADGSRLAAGGEDPWVVVYDTATVFAALDASRPSPKKPAAKKGAPDDSSAKPGKANKTSSVEATAKPSSKTKPKKPKAK